MPFNVIAGRTFQILGGPNMIPYLAYRVRMSFSLKDLLPPDMIWHFFYTALCGCLSRKHCWKRKSKQNPYAATQFVNLSLYAQLLTSSGHIGQTSSLSLKPAQPRFFMLKKEGLRSLVLFRGLRKCQTITILLLYSVAM